MFKLLQNRKFPTVARKRISTKLWRSAGAPFSSWPGARWGNEPILTALLFWDDIGIFDFLCWGDFETPEVFDVLLRG